MASSSARGLGVWALALWFLLGFAVASGAFALQLTAPGAQLSDILRVGADSPARALIDSEIGPVRVTDGLGHDGQYAYLVARDPFALKGLADLADDGGYRFRRALYGWLAGSFGLLPPRGALWGLAAWAIIGFGLATAALADVAASLKARPWAVAGVVGNIGLWLSVQLATADALALGLALVGLALVLRHRRIPAAWVLAAAVLTKDTFLLFPLAIAGWMIARLGYRRAIEFALPSIGVLLAWAVWLQVQIGDGFSLKGNLGAPFVGFMNSLPWLSGADTVLGVTALAGLLLAATGLLLDRSPLMTWLASPWILVAILSSHLVWKDGNNAARALAACWTLGLLMLGRWVAQRDSTSRRNLPV